MKIAGPRFIPRPTGFLRLGAAALWPLLALAACDGGGPTVPETPPEILSVSTQEGSPLASPQQATLQGRGLQGGQLSATYPLAVHADFSNDTRIDFRLSYRGAAPGTYWIQIRTPLGADSAQFVVLGLAADDSIPEARALWISRWEHSTARPAELRTMVTRAAEAGFNLIYFQVRGYADAFYRSAHEPWSTLLTGTLGGDPGYDPLGVAVEEARNRGVELHAWINAFTGWSGATSPTESTPRHAFLEHPEWVMVDSEGRPMPYADGQIRWMTPGNPGVRSRLAAVAADLARNYPVAGIHLDYIRYPGPAYSYDSASLDAFESMRATEPGLTFEEARRRFVTWSVQEVRDSLVAAGTGRALSAAVWGVYRNEMGWTQVTWGYDDIFQAAREWDVLGLVDALAPMVYWTIKSAYGSTLDFAYLADEHAAAIGVNTYVGIYAHDLDGVGLARHIERARLAGAEGVSVFSYSALEAKGLWDDLRDGAFRWPARVPRHAAAGGVVVASR